KLIYSPPCSLWAGIPGLEGRGWSTLCFLNTCLVIICSLALELVCCFVLVLAFQTLIVNFR
uniref:Uncharacterized protein n=1 Tax=Coturnix japonica TaxID=93934 RepID=A0A8C2U5Q7_COTJA